MIEAILTILLILSSLYYLSFLWTVYRGLKRTVLPTSANQPVVSVIVPARNEEQNIRHCLDALRRQDYGNYEIIVVDDHSSDQTRAEAASVCGEHPIPRITVLALGSKRGEHGKAAAIARGIEESTGEIILCTDADCIVPPGWIGSMAGCFDADVAFVAGPVRELHTSNLLMRLQSLEFLSLLTTAAGLIGSRGAIICNGANIGYRKQAFERVEGFGENRSSCDDETLMQRMVKREVGRIVFNSDSHAMVETSTPGTVRDFWSQRTRWAAKRGRYEDPLILLRLISLYLSFVILFLATLVSLFVPELRFVVLAAVSLKILAEYVVLRRGASLFNTHSSLFHFLVAELLHVPYIVFAAAIGQAQSMRWKGRILDQ